MFLYFDLDAISTSGPLIRKWQVLWGHHFKLLVIIQVFGCRRTVLPSWLILVRFRSMSCDAINDAETISWFVRRSKTSLVTNRFAERGRTNTSIVSADHLTAHHTCMHAHYTALGHIQTHTHTHTHRLTHTNTHTRIRTTHTIHIMCERCMPISRCLTSLCERRAMIGCWRYVLYATLSYWPTQIRARTVRDLSSRTLGPLFP